MYYIPVAHRDWSKPESPASKKSRTSEPSGIEKEIAKTSKFASLKTQEYIRNAQRVYFIERRMFS